MFFDDHKKAVTHIVGKRLRKHEPMMHHGAMHDGGEINPMHIAAMDILAAFHENSVHKLAEALEHFMDIYEAHPHVEAEHEE
jgi:hypothetical protein